MTADLRHGGALDKMHKAFPDAPTPWIDLSTGINPWPWPTGSLSPDNLHRLPTSDEISACRRAMANAMGATPDCILPAPGSEILIRLLPDIISIPKVAMLSPTYGDHYETWQRAGVSIIETEDPFSKVHDVDAVILCNPNNPNGRRFEPDDLLAALHILQEKGGWLIVDEAYAELTPELSLAVHGGTPGLIVIRSFGKFFGLAGLRLGALLAPAQILDAMSHRLGVWGVSGTALAIGTAAYADTEWQHQSRIELTEARQKLDQSLTSAGLSIRGGTDLFRFIETQDAHGLWTQLARQGIYVRRFTWSDRHLRIGIPKDEEASYRLTQALK